MNDDAVIKKYLLARREKACLWSTCYDPGKGMVVEYLGEDSDGNPVERAVPRQEVEEWLNILEISIKLQNSLNLKYVISTACPDSTDIK